MKRKTPPQAGFFIERHSPEIHRKHPSPSHVNLLLFTTTQVIVKESRGIPLRDITPITDDTLIAVNGDGAGAELLGLTFMELFPSPLLLL